MIGSADQAYNKGLRCAKEGRLSEAQKLLREAIDLEPAHTEAQNVLGKIYLQLGDLSAARNCWQQSLALSPGNPTASKCLATLWRSELLWQFRTALHIVVILALFVGIGYVARHFQLSGKLAGAAAFIGEIPDNLRAQPVNKLKVSEDTLVVADSPERVVAEVSEPEGASVPTQQGTEHPATPSSSPAEEPQQAEAAPKTQPEAQEPPVLLPELQPETPGSVSDSSISVPRDSQELSALYKEALSLYRGGQPEDAAEAFQSILEAGLESSLLDNAQFWLGECYASQKRYSEAAEAFSQVEFLSDGNKTHDAQIRLRKMQSLMTAN